MKVSRQKDKERGGYRWTIIVHDAETDEEFECELPSHKLSPAVKFLRSRMETISRPDGTKEYLPTSTLFTLPTKEHPHGRAIRVDDLPKLCVRYESDIGDVYLAPEGFSWTPQYPHEK